MTKLFLIGVLCCASFFNEVVAQPDTSQKFILQEKSALLKIDSFSYKLCNIDLNNFLGEEIYLFLLNDTVRSFYAEFHFGDYYRFGHLNGAYLKKVLPDSSIIGIEVFVSDFKYQNSKDLNERWNYKLLLKEKISGIRITWYRGYSRGDIMLNEAGIVP